MTYPQWRTNTRVFHAMIELTKGATVTQTAHRCGWATASAFVDTFTRTMGQTPGAYRAAATHTASARMAGVTTWPLTVNGHDWNVRDRVGEPGAYDYEWLTGPNPYGFSEKTSDGSPVSEAHMREAIADFLAQINPETGYLD
jgi:hypothetical protein